MVDLSTTSEKFPERHPNFDERYERIGNITSYDAWRRRELALDALTRHVNATDATVLEIGCGTGRVISKVIEAHSGWSGCGVDVSQQYVDHCRQTYHDWTQLRFIQGDIADPNFLTEVRAEAILALGVLGYLSDLNTAFNHIYNHIKPGGIFIFTINKPSLPLMTKRAYNMLRFLGRSPAAIFRPYHPDTIKAHLATHWHVLEHYDYAYLPSLPVIRNALFLNKGLERVFGKHITPLSYATLFVTQRQP